MATTIAGIGFELTFDGSKMMASINTACDKVRSHFTNSFSEAGNAAAKAVETSNQAIREILNDTEKSMKSKASSIAAIYRKEGDSISDAMRKAWSHIERDSAEEAEEVKGHFISIKRKAKDSADKMSGSFTTGFSKMKRDAESTGKSISSSLSGMAKKVTAALASAFAVKKIIDFGKECINLGSDLQEVQNVVDVTFPNMADRVNEFAKTAITTAGLSETMAKQYTGTFGAMAKAFGFSESAAYEMSTTLTQLAGDVASFYNLSQDEAYTKLKSVFSGETETLKDLGVVMTQNALDAYALANGYGKTTSAMTEMEKVALRYKFVQSQLSAAQGDFARTSDSWANQTRIMTLQLQSIMATVGQGLINLFTPAIKMINTLLSKIATLAAAFKGFTELITGKKSAGGSGITDNLTSGLTDATAAAGDTSSGLTDAAGSAGNLADNTGAVGAAAKKAAKEMKALMGFDEIQKLPEISDSEGDSGGGGEGNGGGSDGGNPLDVDTIDFGKLAESENDVLTKTNKTLDKLIKKVKELAKICKKGFFDGLGDLDVLGSIQKECKSISESLVNIFTDRKVLTAADNLARTVSYNLGKVAGSIASVGLSIADNLLGGVSKYLEQNGGKVKSFLVGMFDIYSERATLVGNVDALIADIVSILQSDTAKQITANVIAFFANGFMGVVEIGNKFGTDFLSLIITPFTDNADAIKESLEGFLEPLESITGTLVAGVTQTFQSIRQVYDEHIAPMFETLRQGFSEIIDYLCETFNATIKPVLDEFAVNFATMWTEHIQPAIDNGITFFGKLADTVSFLWTEYLQPLITWMIETFGPLFAQVIEASGVICNTVFGAISDLLKTIFDVLSGLLDFIVNVFKGDWDAAWEDIKNVFETLWNGISAFIMEIWDSLCIYFGEVWEAIQAVFEPVIQWFSDLFEAAWTGIKGAWDGAATFFSNIWIGITETFSDAKTWLTDVFQSAWDGIADIWDDVTTWFTDNVSTPLSTLFSDLWGEIETFASDTWDRIVGIFKAGGTIFDGFVTSVKDVFVSLVNGIITGINNVIKTPFQGINSVLDGIRGVSILGATPFGWVPTISIPQIPQLAQGGFVEKNTPQLAMIGDNRHQGEVVAPEDKLLEMAKMAASMGGNPELLQKIISLLETLISLVQGGDDIVLSVDSEELARAVMTGSLRLKRRYTTVEVTI